MSLSDVPQAPNTIDVVQPPRRVPEKAMAEMRLYSSEVFWRDRYNWLKEHGYLLRPRYHPDWVASWKDKKKLWIMCEDGQVETGVEVAISATRIEDGAPLKLKKIRSSAQDEIAMARFLSESPHGSLKTNHCVPFYDVLDVPDDPEHMIIVMPFLSHWEHPEFDTIGEVVDFLRQFFEGLDFMHQLNVAHNDVKFDNVMMDANPLYDERPHPADDERNMAYTRRIKHHSRTSRPVNYYLIDFGLSCQYDSDNEPPLIPVGSRGYGGDKSVPEFRTEEYCDPFPVDVYRAGNFVRENFIMVGRPVEMDCGRKRGFSFIEPLIEDMCQDDPTKRPTMSEVVSRFDELTKALSWWKLRSRVIEKSKSRFISALGFPGHWVQQVYRILRKIPAIPQRYTPGT